MAEAVRWSLVEMVRLAVLQLVDNGQAVDVRGVMQDGCLAISVRVASDDVGKIIGKQGRTARALRAIVAAVAMKQRIRCELNIVEPAREVQVA